MAGGSSEWNSAMARVLGTAIAVFLSVACTSEKPAETFAEAETSAPEMASASQTSQEPAPEYLLESFLASDVGHSWSFENLAPDGLSPILISSPGSVKRDGETWVRREENNGDWRLQRMGPSGLILRELYFRGGTTVQYAEPALLMPRSLAEGQEHLSETPYSVSKRAADGAPLLIEEGLQTYRVTLKGEEQVEVPAGSFRCLQLRTQALRVAHVAKDGEAAEKGYDLRECYARGVGPVRVQGEIFWNSADGSRIRTFEVDAVLSQHAGPVGEAEDVS